MVSDYSVYTTLRLNDCYGNNSTYFKPFCGFLTLYSCLAVDKISQSLCVAEFLVDTMIDIITPPPIGERSIVMIVPVCLCVCVFVCPRSYLQNYTSDLNLIFCACYLWQRLGPPLAA